jgi:hypothetical protein
MAWAEGVNIERVRVPGSWKSNAVLAYIIADLCVNLLHAPLDHVPLAHACLQAMHL